jgi:hypothetical protein
MREADELFVLGLFGVGIVMSCCKWVIFVERYFDICTFWD